MPPELLHSLLSSLGGLVVLTLFGLAIYQLWRHRRLEGPLVRGIKVKTEPLERDLVEPPRRLEGDEQAPWGWYRAEGDSLHVFVDPYYRGEGAMRIKTMWTYGAEVRFDPQGAQVIFRAPFLSTLLFGPLFLPMFGMPLLLHAALVGRIRERLRRLAG